MKVLLWVVGLPVGLFVLWMIIFLISEGVSDTQYFASQAGMSIRECREFSMRLGATYGDADAMCSKRVPKK